jgi:hypothetical protein
MCRDAARPHSESGNVIFFILLAVALIALVTAAVRGGGESSGNVDREALAISESQVRQYASELERGVTFVLHNGASESDIRFAYADAPSDYGDITVNPQFQIFSAKGGGAEYRLPPGGVNDGSGWEFYGNTALPNAGSARAELTAVLPHVTDDFCRKVNAADGYDASLTLADSGVCLEAGGAGRFNDSTQYDDAGPNTVDTATFPALKPAMEGCATCTDGSHHFFHVLIAR